MSATASSRELLSNIHLFSGLEGAELTALTQIAGRRSVAPGETVVRQGDTNEHLYGVGQGLLQVSRETENTREIVFSVLRTGDLFGEVALFDKKTRSATVTALKRCELLAFPREQLLVILQRHPALALRLLEYMAHTIRRLTVRAEQLSELEVPVRVAKKLLEMAEICGTRIDANCIALPLTLRQQDLANHVQATRESVNRCVVQFVRQGLLHQTRDRLTILDVQGLSRVGNHS